ncbi:MAG: DNA-protecting protein DprA [Mycobacterium sp.]|nr:DNA-protecting protein DprA [Mycobacterium sp.]
MSDDDVQRAALVALLRQPRARWSDITADIVECGDATSVLHELLHGDALFPSADPAAVIKEAEDLIAAWAGEGIRFRTFLDDDYPGQLRDIREMPPVLFSRGSDALDARAVAVVGTRQATEQGLKVAEAVARCLAEHGVTVVSGLAAGIDTAAHRAALGAGGRTVAVIGTGIRRYYPKENRSLQDQIAAKGLVLSQFWPDAPPTRQSFPMRNAVMSGYSAATVVVEASWRSGARIQARLALQHGRPVVMPKELLVHDWARAFAENPGVRIVASMPELIEVVEDLIETMSVSAATVTGIPGLAGV